jgi:hypothetical protein
MNTDHLFVMLKKLASAIFILTLVFAMGCASSSDDDDDDEGSSTSNTFSATITGDGTISGTHTSDATAGFEYDPAVAFSYNTSDSEYNMVFVKNYDVSNGIVYGGPLSTFDNYSELFIVNFKGTPATGNIGFTSSDPFYIDTVLYSPDGVTDIYLGSTGIGSATINITSEGASVGDQFTGTITEATLWKFESDFSGPVDGGVTNKVISAGSFNIKRDADEQ